MEKEIRMSYSEYESLVKERDELKEKLVEVGKGLPSVVIDNGEIGISESGRIMSERQGIISGERLYLKNNTLTYCPVLVIKTEGEVSEEVKRAVEQNEQTLKYMVDALKKYKENHKRKSNSKAARRWWQ